MRGARSDGGEAARARSAWLLAALVFSGGVNAHEVAAGSQAASSELVAQALAYEHGEGVPRDAKRAAELYCEAARGGDAEAMFSLGWMYANGRGVARDEAAAAALFARAAKLGHEYAKRMSAIVGEDPQLVAPCLPVPELEQVAVPVDLPPDPFAALPPEKKKVADLVTRLAPSYSVQPRLALAIVAAESNFEPTARSPKDAQGAMQLVAGTAQRFRVRNRFDVVDNVRGGLAYLRWLLAHYEGRVALAVAAYNAGEGAVDSYGGVPPYRETRDYVARVLHWFPAVWHEYVSGIAEPSPIAAGAETATKAAQ